MSQAAVRRVARSTLRLLRTTRHLRWSQWSFRARRWMASRRLSASRAQPPKPESLAGDFPRAPFLESAAPNAELVPQLERGELRLLNQTEFLGRDQINWRLGPVATGRLWTVTLHYHQWLFELASRMASGGADSQQAKCLFELHLSHWLNNCGLDRPGADALAWNSYAIATRLGWSIRAWQLLRDAGIAPEDGLSTQWCASLFAQADHLSRHLEWDLRANHLLRDAVGLAWAGRFFNGRRAERWLQVATELAVQQADEQMLPDGGHFERSPFYHLEVMDDWFTLAHLLRDEQTRTRLRETWLQAAEFACWLRHPDGRVVQWNDGASTLVDKHLLHAHALNADVDRSPRRGGRQFADSGVVVWHGNPWSVFLDVGLVGPDYQPGHAHADTLSVECSYNGQRLFVDPGCHSYDRDQRRHYDRSTAAHNTVCIDGEDSSEVWHIFRVGRRARPIGVQTAIRHDRVESTAAHTGYDHLAGRPRHTRQMAVNESGPFLIWDRVTGAGDHTLAGGFLLAPDWFARPITDGWLVSSGSQKVRVSVTGPESLQCSVVTRPWHPDYGIEVMTQRLQWEYRGRLPFEVCIRIVAA